MTSLLPATRRTAPQDADARSGRPLALIAALGGVAAAGATLLLCLGLGVVGWFLTDAGAHAEPHDALRSGALGWLTAHGSGVRLDGVRLTAAPLGMTLLCVWAAWRLGHRVGNLVSGHGPDADDIVDGQRDWTVPVASALFAAGYVTTAVLTSSLAATEATDPSNARVVGFSLLIALGAGGAGIATGSGRAALWASLLPPTARVSLRVCRRMLALWVLIATIAFVVAFVLDLSTAANVMSQLHTDAGSAALVVALSLLLVPQAVLFSSSFLLGPGFTVGTGTLVAPGAVVLGPLPVFPLLAALPDEGAGPAWTPWLVALPPLVALLAVVSVQRTFPTTRYDEGALRGLVGGVLAAVALTIATALAGGAVGPGRMREVGPLTFDVLLHALTAFGLGGLVGGLAITWWQRRSMQIEITLDD